MLPRKHYVTFSRILDNAAIAARARHPEGSAERAAALRTVRDLAQDFANFLAGDNPRFDRDRFFQACADANPSLGKNQA